MIPTYTPDAFWQMLPHWAWWVVIIGMVCAIVFYVITKAIALSDKLADQFGAFGRHFRDKATIGRTTLRHVKRIEDNLDCALTYLVHDDDWHDEHDCIVRVDYPDLIPRLPSRIPYSEHQQRWRDGWRPTAYQEV